MLYIVISLAIILLVVGLFWWNRRAASCAELEGYDAQVAGGVAEVGVVTRLAVETAMACKEKYGEMRYNNANRLVVGDFCRDYLRTQYPDLRHVDRVMHSGYAVELALTPTLFAVSAARFAREPLVAERRRMVAPPK